MRTDEHRNPTAFTTDIAKQAGLILHQEYEIGRAFADNPKMFTAKLLLNPIELTLRVIDKIGFYTKAGKKRWEYIAMPPFVWQALSREERVRVIGFMYGREGGTAMKQLFPTA